jgi:hypothetical protein
MKGEISSVVKVLFLCIAFNRESTLADKKLLSIINMVIQIRLSCNFTSFVFSCNNSQMCMIPSSLIEFPRSKTFQLQVLFKFKISKLLFLDNDRDNSFAPRGPIRVFARHKVVNVVLLSKRVAKYSTPVSPI